MLIAPPVHLSARQQAQPSAWELALRYAAATAATLLAIAGAQLVTPNPLIYLLTLITLTGVPISVALRVGDMRIGGVLVPRPLLNSATVLGSFGAAFYLVILPMGDLVGSLLGGDTANFWLSFGGGEPVTALMQMFLLFAAFRSFAIISDKDATLTTVPSFSVLLLLIPIHKGIEVVFYFVAWTLVAATLFALDHRSEVRAGVSATVPAIEVGQDVKLGARSLATILAISLAAASGISFYLASRNPEERSATETAVTALASRLTNLALSLPEVSPNSGPERQIDFKSGPSLPSRARLWRVEASTFGRKPVYPSYWRMFTLSNYDGVSWMQNNSKPTSVPLGEISQKRWPVRRLWGVYERGNEALAQPQSDMGQQRYERGGRPSDGIEPRRDQGNRNAQNSSGVWSFGRSFGQNGFGFGGAAAFPSNFSDDGPVPGYNVEGSQANRGRQFRSTGFLVRQRITSLVPNIGFLPIQPTVRGLTIRQDQPKEIRVRDDGAIDIGVMSIGQSLRVLSDAPPQREYGSETVDVPLQKLSAAQIAASGIALPKAERELDLRLPDKLPARVRELSADMVRRSPQNSSNYGKASRIALAIQQNAVYTLRPPSIPEGRDATDYFLFEGARRGYCTYFAGALTVLCRAQGIPARVVSGFAGIHWEGPDAGILREANAHAWTEVWVEGFGWAVVDATPASERGDNAPTWIESWSDVILSSLSNATMWAGTHERAFQGFVAALLLIALVWRSRSHSLESWRWQRQRDRDDDFERRAVAQVYRRAARGLTRRFRPKSSWETPDEWLRSCAGGLSKPDAEALRRLTALYLAARYGSVSLPRGSGRLARETAASVGWKRVRN